MFLEDIVIVLARPSEPGNTGAVCRAMKNMGLHRLRIAAPEPGIPLPDGIAAGEKSSTSGNPASLAGGNTTGPDSNPKDCSPALEKLLARAIHAADIWNGAEHFACLEEALADCSISVGTSRRRGRHRKSNTLTPRELAEFLKTKTGRAAIVFGNERTGLDREELELCSIASHIPVSPEFPSINLSHAVQIYAYELYQTLTNGNYKGACPGPAPIVGQWVPMTIVEIDGLVKKTSNALESIGFYKRPGRAEQERFLRDLIARAGLSLNEGRYLSSIITKAGRLMDPNSL